MTRLMMAGGETAGSSYDRVERMHKTYLSQARSAVFLAACECSALELIFHVLLH